MSDAQEKTFAQRLDAIHQAARDVQTICRAATADLVKPDASVRQVAKRLRIGEYIAWKLIHMIRSEHVAKIIAAIPGDRGRTAIITALATVAEGDHAARLQRSFDALDMACRNLGCRLSEVASMSGSGDEPTAIRRRRERVSRRLSEDFAKLRGHRISLVLGGSIAVPSPDDPDIFDVHFYQLCHGITRFRPGVPILVHMGESIEDEEWKIRGDGLGRLLRSASTPDLEDEEVVISHRGDRMLIHVDPRPDRTEPITTAFMEFHPKIGEVLPEVCRGLPRRRFLEVMSMPIQHLVVEYFQPRSVPEPTDVFATSEFTTVTWGPPSGTDPHDRVPVDLPLETMDGSTLPEALASARPFHDAIIRAALERSGGRPEDLRGYRTIQNDPPPASMITLGHFPARRPD